MTRMTETSIIRSFTQSDFDCFARLSGDENPIHVDSEFSARTRFGRPVAHGLLLCSVLRALIEDIVPGGHLHEQCVMFPAPTFAGEPMRFFVQIVGDGERDSRQAFHCEMEVKRLADELVTCQGTASVRCSTLG